MIYLFLSEHITNLLTGVIVENKLIKDQMVTSLILHIAMLLKKEKNDGEIRNPELLNLMKQIGFDWEYYK